MKKGTGTRSGLLWEVERLLKELLELEGGKDNLPSILLMENVPSVLSAEGWREWVFFLESIGYTNYCDTLNASNYGIPQNRARAYMLSIKDIGGGQTYNFPSPMKLDIRLKDLLENDVDEKYYLSPKMMDYLMANDDDKDVDTKDFPRRERFILNIDRKHKEIANTISTRSGSRPVDNFIFDNEDDIKMLVELNRGYSVEVKAENEDSQDIDVIGNYSKSNGVLLYGNHGLQETLDMYDVEDGDFIDTFNAGTITTRVSESNGTFIAQNLRIRKLTCKECFRLMGVKDQDFNKLSASNNQLYKQAGNSIVTSVLMAIYSPLFNIDYQEKIKELIKEIKQWDID